MPSLRFCNSTHLAATRTGLTPASDDELTTKDHLQPVTSSLLGARIIEANKIGYSRQVARNRRPWLEVLFSYRAMSVFALR
jgi:hypothetical protein